MKAQINTETTRKNMPLPDRLDDVEERLDTVERRQDTVDSKLDVIKSDVVAIRAESTIRADMTNSGVNKLSLQISDLSKDVAKHTGAVHERNRIHEEHLKLENIGRAKAETRLANWKRRLAVISLLVMLAGTAASALLSRPEIASHLWTEVLHRLEPWDESNDSKHNSGQP